MLIYQVAGSPPNATDHGCCHYSNTYFLFVHENLESDLVLP